MLNSELALNILTFQNCAPSGVSVGLSPHEDSPVSEVLTEGAGTTDSDLDLEQVSPVFTSTKATSETLPQILVNHDLYVHTDYGLESGTPKEKPNVRSLNDTQAVQTALNAISDNHKELSSLGAGFSLNASYGSHDLWYWGSTTHTYRQWWNALLKTQAEDYFTSGFGYIDTLVLNKFIGAGDFISGVLARKSSEGPFMISVRMNDHHHLEDVEDFLAPKDLPVSAAPFSRRVAGLSPEYRTFLAQGKVISGVENPPRGKTGQGLGCDKKGDEGKFSYHLDFSDDAVLKHKIKQIEDLFKRYDDLDGVELDFLRANCYFPIGTKLDRKKEVMKSYFDSVFAAKASFTLRTGKTPLLTIRVPLDESPLNVHGINVAALAGNDKLDGVIFGYSKPYLRSQVIANPIHSLSTKHAGLKVYYELYQITDGQTKRRPATEAEIATSAYEALNAGYNGVSLFNFHYLFKHNSLLKQEYAGQAFSWASILNLLKDRVKMKTSIRPTYFFGAKNAVGDFQIGKLNDSATTSFRFSKTSRLVDDTAVLRIIHEGEAPNALSWKDVRFHVKINGQLVKNPNGSARVSSISTSYGRDPIRFFDDAEVKEWGPGSSQHIVIPASYFKHINNTVEVILVQDSKKVFKSSSRIQIQLSM